MTATCSLTILVYSRRRSAAARARQTIAQGKPIHIIVGFAAGGATDIVARMLGAKISEILGQQVDHREPHRRRGHDRDRGGGARRTRRHHAADGATRQCGERDAVRKTLRANSPPT